MSANNIKEYIKFSFLLDDAEATDRFGEDMALALRKGDFISLSGDLGAGKSSLARSIIRTIADDLELDVPSPTFTLVQTYEDLRLPVAHADLYRISTGEEVDELGFDEFLQDGIVLAEWPEQAENYLPAPTFKVVLKHPPLGQHGRLIEISATARAAKRLERSLAIRQFLNQNDRPNAQRRYLLGDASPRAYETITSRYGTEILMDAPPMPFDPILREGKSYRQIAHLAENCIPFSALAKLIKAKGFCVPVIQAEDLDQGFLLLEHLGYEGVLDENRQPISERYETAARFLAHFHQIQWPDHISVEKHQDYQIAQFDRDAMMIEVELLCQWYAPRFAGYQLNSAQKESFIAAWDEVFNNLKQAEQSLLLRDYHSPNLFWFEERQGIHRIGMIDFQDAMIGPAAYDVASLALDARVTISPELEKAVVLAYCDERKKLNKAFDEESFKSAYAIMGAQRNSKILGIFVRLDERDGKPNYLNHIPRIRDYLARTLIHPSLKPVQQWYAENGLLSVGENA